MKDVEAISPKDPSEYLPGCSGKVVYLNIREAKDAARKMTSLSSVHIYHCKYLSFGDEHWHVTSMPRHLYKNISKNKK